MVGVAARARATRQRYNDLLRRDFCGWRGVLRRDRCGDTDDGFARMATNRPVAVRIVTAPSGQAEASLRREAQVGSSMLGIWPPGAGYGLIAKLRVVQPELEALPPGAASIELPQTWPVVPVAGAAGSGVAAA